MEVHPILDPKSVQEVLQNHELLVEELEKSKKYIQSLENNVRTLQQTIIQFLREQEEVKYWVKNEILSIKEQFSVQDYPPENLCEKIFVLAKTFCENSHLTSSKEKKLVCKDLTNRMVLLEEANSRLRAKLVALEKELRSLKDWILVEIEDIRNELRIKISTPKANTIPAKPNFKEEGTGDEVVLGKMNLSDVQKQSYIDILRKEVNSAIKGLEKQKKEAFYDFLFKKG